MPGENNNTLDNFGTYEDKKFIPEVQNIEEDQRNLISKSSAIGSRARAGCTLQDGLLRSDLSSSLKEVRFSE